MLGVEGSANKIGVGIVSDEGLILSNPRHTYDPPYVVVYKIKLTLSAGLEKIAPEILAVHRSPLAISVLRADSACLADTLRLPGRAFYRKRQLCTIRQDIPHH